MMDIQEFVSICQSDQSNWPDKWHPLVRALAFDQNGFWDAAHNIAQNDLSRQGCAVHAYLHRKEGVQWNAEYWYQRSGRKPFTGSLTDEWTALVRELLAE